MKYSRAFTAHAASLTLVLLLLTGFACSCSCPSASKHTGPIKTVVVTGGHDFEHDPFFTLFQDCPDIEYVEAIQADHSEIFEDISAWDYDVIVLYSMTQSISPQRRENFTKLLKRGVGLVALHHSVGSFQEWDEFRKIIGARYCLKQTEIDGAVHPASSYKHDLDFSVHVEDPKHPITSGINDFRIHDETYKDCWFAEDNHVLLTTNEPTSDKTLAAVRKYAKARVCYLQLGHDSKAYANPNYRQLVRRAIKWSAGRLK